jgi:carbon-monoxide dehydrogenase medium subunit
MASVAPVTHPLLHVREYVEGKKLTDVDREALFDALAEDVTPIDDVRSTGEYRMHVAKALLRDAIFA